MKHKILIVEDNYYKFFTIQQLLKTKFRLNINVMTAASKDDLIEAAYKLNPDIFFCKPNGGVMELADQLKNKKLNRRNTEVTMVVASDCDELTEKDLKACLSAALKRKSYAQAA